MKCRNPKCSPPLDFCDDCKGQVVRDGHAVRVPMMMMDSMQRAVAANAPAGFNDAVREEARRDHEAWKAQGQPIQHDGISEYHALALGVNARSNAATLADAQRRGATIQAARDHAGNASEKAYAAMCDELQNAHRRA